MADVFLSYARADAEAAMAIKSALEALGLTVFIDTESFHAGEEFPVRLEREIEAAGAVLSLWNAYSLSREWVRRECELALDLKKLLPGEIGPITDRVLTVEFSRLHRTDLTGFDGSHDHKGWRDTVKSLADKLNRPDILREDTRLKDAERRMEEERDKERQRLAWLEKQNADLKKQTGSLKPWNWAVGSVMAVAMAAGAAWYGLTYGARSAHDQLRASIITPEMQLAMDELDIENASSSRDALKGLLENVSLGRLLEASAIGDAQASLLAGWAYDFGEGGVTEDKTEATRLYRRACLQNSMRGCTNLGFWYVNGEGVPKDYEVAKRLHQLACDGGEMRACKNLGWQYKYGIGVERDNVEANRLYKLACDGGVMTGCINLGVQYANGEGVPVDDAEANKLYNIACKGGEMRGCINLGFQYANGRGVPVDDVEANRLYKLTCDGGDMMGCRLLAFRYANGKGVPVDTLEANRLNKLACDGGDITGCGNLGPQ